MTAAKRKARKTTPKREQVRRERDPKPWKYCLVTLVFGIVLVAGFFLAARTHFASVDFGIRNSDLKRELEELRAERRRLLLSREMALSPGEIKRAARRLGLTDIRATNIVAPVPAERSVPAERTVQASTAPLPAADERPRLVKTSYVRPVAKPSEIHSADPRTDERRVPKTGR